MTSDAAHRLVELKISSLEFVRLWNSTWHGKLLRITFCMWKRATLEGIAEWKHSERWYVRSCAWDTNLSHLQDLSLVSANNEFVI